MRVLVFTKTLEGPRPFSDGIDTDFIIERLICKRVRRSGCSRIAHYQTEPFSPQAALAPAARAKLEEWLADPVPEVIAIAVARSLIDVLQTLYHCMRQQSEDFV